MSDPREWMYKRLNSNGRLSEEFKNGVKQFTDFAFAQVELVSENKVRCPCVKCNNLDYQTLDDVTVHLYQRGFTNYYKLWIAQGERSYNRAPEIHHSSDLHFGPQASNDDTNNREDNAGYTNMLIDAFGPQASEDDTCDTHRAEVAEKPNPDAKKFYDLLEDINEELWPGCKKHTKLSAVAQLMNCKSEFNVSDACHDRYLSIIKSMLPENSKFADTTYQSKKIMKKLGLRSEKIDSCTNNCMLFYKENSGLHECSICGHPRYKPKQNIGSSNRKDVPNKVLRYLPLTPRLQRLYMSSKTAKDMVWHAQNKCPNNVVEHPSDSEAWKHFDQIYPDFASEYRNVRIGICTDGFNPYGHSANPYTCWPVLVVIYNLPPWMCMKQSFMFMPLLIPGPKSPTKNLDVFLRPLIDELKLLWHEGVVTFDSGKKQNFTMRAAVMWTISDFPAYAMLSGWSTHGKLACPYCMEHNKSFTLQFGGKVSFFDCHRQFLPLEHPFRKQKDKFRKGVLDMNPPPRRLSGEELFDVVSRLPDVTFGKSKDKIAGFGRTHNWVRRSIFWELPYWRTNLIRHNLDVMHIERNVFENIFNTVMDVKDKTKDNTKARLDLALLCKRPELELIEVDGKQFKPKAAYTLTKEQVKDVCAWVKNLRFPDGYAANLSNCVNLQDSKFYGMKSHDCHIFMQRLLPIAFRDSLPLPIWDSLTDLSIFFRDICSVSIHTNQLKKMETNIIEILCKLEKIFPPSFFDSMEHVVMHLPYEARVGGPVQYRWMYPFERAMQHLKKKARNKANIEGSICEAYLVEEISTFCSMYFEDDVPTKWNKLSRYADGDAKIKGAVSVFNLPGRTLTSRGIRRILSEKEFEAARLYVLLNCDEINPFLERFDSIKQSDSLNITRSQLDKLRADEFPSWLTHAVCSESPINRHLFSLANGPARETKAYTGYFVNGFKFHTKNFGSGKTTMNSGIWVKGSDFDDPSLDFYGMLSEVIEVDYNGNKVTLFKVDWYDTSTRGLRIDKHGLIDIKYKSKLAGYEPFILATQAQQVYYTNYPSKNRDKSEWWSVCKNIAKNEISTQHIQIEEEEFYQSERVSLTNYTSSLLDELDDSSLLACPGILEEVEGGVQQKRKLI